MLHTLLVALDGSSLAEEALGPACRLAAQTSAQLLLVRAVPAATHTGGPSAPSVRLAETYLEALQGRLVATGFPVRVQVLRTDAARAITFAARMQGADLIIMATHGHTGLRRTLLGSVAQAVLERTMLPVLLVRGGLVETAPRTRGFRSVLVPLDGTAESEATLRFLAHAGLDRASTVTLLRVVAPFPTTLTSDWYDASAHGETAEQEQERQVAAARQYLETVAARELEGKSPSLQVLVGPPGPAIAEAASSQAIELIALATHGRTGLDRLLHGSVATHVLHHAQMPVLIVHAAAQLRPVVKPATEEATAAPMSRFAAVETASARC